MRLTPVFCAARLWEQRNPVDGPSSGRFLWMQTRRQIATHSPIDDEETRESCRSISGLLHHGSSEVTRTISHSLRSLKQRRALRKEGTLVGHDTVGEKTRARN